MQEDWKDIAGYEGRYQVSNFGNVKSLNWRGTGIAKNLYLKKSNKGYLHVELSDGKSKKSITVHRLVANAFIPNPNNYNEINHKDENTLNNCVDNLEWCTHKYNVSCYFLKHPDHALNRKHTEKYGKRINLRVLQFEKNGKFIREWPNSRTAFLETGMSDWGISECCRGNRKSANGYIWRYAN